MGMVSFMDFRKNHCSWCLIRTGPLEDCAPCPKYRRYELKDESVLTMDSFCSICINQGSLELEVFCRTNRYLQEDSGEDFDCYKFCMKVLKVI
jgi:hypothetical protein